MNLIQSNIDNLTSLWSLGGKAAGGFLTNTEYSISIVSNSEWPNKLWFHKNPDQDLIDKILQKWNLNSLSMPLWDTQLAEGEKILKSCGFTIKNELIGMSKSLDRIPGTLNGIHIRKVEDTCAAARWSQLFYAAFGYQINPETVQLTMDKADYYIGYQHEEPIGTAVLYRYQPAIAGIHSMGVVPINRRKGFAEALLLLVLDVARQSGATHATLQASAMGKGLYLKTGFKEDFLLKNFVKH